MLYGMAFHLPDNVTALHLDDGNVKAYLYNQGGAVYFFYF